MLIVRTITDFYPKITGPANQAFYVSKYLHEYYGWNSIIVTVNNKERSVKIQDLGFATVIRLPLMLPKNFLGGYGFVKGYLSFLSRIKPSVVHNHGYRNFFCDATFHLRPQLNFKRVVSCHGTVLMYRYIHTNRISWFPYLFYDAITAMKSLKEADVIITSSEQEKKELDSIGIPHEKIWVIPMGAHIPDLDNYKKLQAMKCQKEKIIILTVGRWEQSRRLEIIVNAFQKVYNTYKNVELWIVGPEASRSTFTKKGYLTSIKQLVDKLGISRNVKFLGELTGEDLQKIYAKADIFVYASLYENFGQTILEAGSFGLPIISTPVGIAPEIVINNKTGFLYNFDDYQTLAEKINLLVINDSLRMDYSNNVVKLVREKFSWDKIIPKYKELYESLSKK